MAHPSLEDQAAEWLARLDREDAGAADRTAFEAWRSADPKHEAACTRLEIGWQRFDRLQALQPPHESPDPHLLGNATLLTDFPTPAQPVVRRGSWAWPQYALAAAVGTLSVGAIVYGGLHARVIGNQTYATRVGEYRRIVLDDQSIVELDTATRLNVSLTPQQRELQLVQGQARFTVAKDPHRPFIVDAGQTRVRVLGTAFSVRRGAQTVEVVVTEGRVAVDTESPQAPRIVDAGERAAALPRGIEVQRLSPREAERSTAWAEGILAFEGATLETMVAEFNRYNKTQLSVADPALASLRMGGYFRATSLDTFLATLGRSFGIRAERAGPNEMRLVGPSEP